MIERKNMGHQYHWEENPLFVILLIRRSPRFTQFEQGKFQSQNVSELKSSSGNSSSDYINYFAEHGEQ